MIDERLLARLATEPPAAQQMAYRLLMGECPSRPPEQSEECQIVSKTTDILDSINRHLTVPRPEADGPRAAGFAAELLPHLEEGRKRRLARQKEFDAFVRVDLDGAWPYAAVPRITERSREAVAIVRLAGLAEIRRMYVSNSCGWMVGMWPLGSAGWAVLPYPDAPTAKWSYASDLPEVLALADELGADYHRPPIDQPRAPTLEQRGLDLLEDCMNKIYQPDGMGVALD